MNNPFSQDFTPNHSKQIPKTNNSKKKLVIGIIIIVIVFLIGATVLIIKRLSSYNAPQNLSLEYNLGYGYIFNYNANWKVTQDSSIGLILTNADNTTITFTSAKVSNKNLDQIVQSRIDALKNSNVNITTDNVTFNNINFKHIQLTNKTDANIIKPDTINAYATLKGDIYTLVTIVNSAGKDISEADQIVKTFRTT